MVMWSIPAHGDEHDGSRRRSAFLHEISSAVLWNTCIVTPSIESIVAHPCEFIYNFKASASGPWETVIDCSHLCVFVRSKHFGITLWMTLESLDDGGSVGRRLSRGSHGRSIGGDLISLHNF